MSRLTLDVKVAARTVVRARFVSVLAVIASALGIGVTTAMFNTFNGVLLSRRYASTTCFRAAHGATPSRISSLA